MNTKGSQFEVDGMMWSDDGTRFFDNPRPDRYPQYAGLMSDGPKRELSWVVDRTDLVPGPVAPFSIRSEVLTLKKPRTRKPGKITGASKR